MEIACGTFRPDLHDRIGVVTVELPPLRARRVDIPCLTEYFVIRHAERYGCAAPPIRSQVMDLLVERDWPGNIRELENAIRRYVILGSEETLIEESHQNGFTAVRGCCDEGLSLKARMKQAVQELERKLILDALHANNWNRRAAARMLKISYRSFMYKLKSAGLPPKRRRQQHRPEASAGSTDNPANKN